MDPNIHAELFNSLSRLLNELKTKNDVPPQLTDDINSVLKTLSDTGNDPDYNVLNRIKTTLSNAASTENVDAARKAISASGVNYFGICPYKNCAEHSDDFKSPGLDVYKQKPNPARDEIKNSLDMALTVYKGKSSCTKHLETFLFKCPNCEIGVFESPDLTKCPYCKKPIKTK